MKNIVNLSSKELQHLFSETSLKKKIPLAMVEKDFWVCYVLSQLFLEPELKSILRFKGGTSLSKGYGLIKRFSEDLDLILDKSIIIGEKDVFETSSQKKQRKYTEDISEKTAEYVSTKLKTKIEKLLTNKLTIYTDEEYIKENKLDRKPDNKSLHIIYPKSTSDKYLRPDILLEIGIMSASTPYEDRDIIPYIAEISDKLAINSFKVSTVKPTRTFWDKATILHREFYRPIDTHTPARYSRHYHDLYQLGKSFVKEEALCEKKLLEDVVERKKWLYHCPWAKYDDCLNGNIHLLPNDNNKVLLEKDYKTMQNMIYGEIPSWDEILHYLFDLEEEINRRLK